MEEKILFRVESHIFAAEEQIPMTEADFFLRIFEAIPGTLKLFETPWKWFEYPLKTHFEMLGKNIPLFCIHYPHAGECVTELHVIISYFFQRCFLLHGSVLIYL